MTKPVTIERAVGDISICLQTVPVGADLVVVICGGDRPHIGALALSQARPSLQDKEIISTTTSILTLLGHKEDQIAKKAGERIARCLNATVTVACGIHVDDINVEQLGQVEELINDLTEELLDYLQK